MPVEITSKSHLPETAGLQESPDSGNRDSTGELCRENDNKLNAGGNESDETPKSGSAVKSPMKEKVDGFLEKYFHKRGDGGTSTSDVKHTASSTESVVIVETDLSNTAGKTTDQQQCAPKLSEEQLEMEKSPQLDVVPHVESPSAPAPIETLTSDVDLDQAEVEVVTVSDLPNPGTTSLGKDKKSANLARRLTSMFKSKKAMKLVDVEEGVTATTSNENGPPMVRGLSAELRV